MEETFRLERHFEGRIPVTQGGSEAGSLVWKNEPVGSYTEEYILEQ